MYPFTKNAVSYIKKWPEKCKQRDCDSFIVEIAKEAANEERGHDSLILEDLKTLKIPIQIALNKFQSESVQICISQFKKSVEENPLHLLAWLYWGEKRAVDTVTAEVFQSYQKMLGPYKQAMRFWRIHSAVGPDVEHLEKRKRWIEALPFHQTQILMQEFDKITRIRSEQHFDLDCEEFDRFMSEHAPHLVDLAWAPNYWRFLGGH